MYPADIRNTYKALFQAALPAVRNTLYGAQER